MALTFIGDVIKASEYSAVVGSLTKEEKVHFYETLAHNLTVSARVVWSNEELTDSEIIEQLKVLNEIQYRVTSKIHVERTERRDWPESGFIAKVLHYFKLCPGIASMVGHAINGSYDIVVKEGS